MGAVEKAAGTDTTVLLEGESGTGKELCARALHSGSARANGPFVAINCAAIPETLLEAELFGYERGAFTGANTRKIGKFEMAQRGTIFLDEIGEMPMGVQAKMLRAIETKRIERLGGGGSFQVDVRIVAATNRKLRQAVAARQFREDLYFRLSVFPITVPPLRDRKEDIPLLAMHFVDRVCRDVGKRLTVSEAAIAELVAYPWPGNVRELQNVIERAVILSDGDTLLPRHLSLVSAALQRHAGGSVGSGRSVGQPGGSHGPDHAERRSAERSCRRCAMPATIAAAPRTCCRSTSRRSR